MGFVGSGWGFSGSAADSGGIAENRLRYNVELIGTKNGVNTVFTTPDLFLPETLRVYWAGVRQIEAAASDFTVSESGGAGTGYDTVTMAVAPLADDNLLADYHIPAS